MSDEKIDPITASSAVSETPGKKDFHYARRGTIASEAIANSEIEGYDAERMKARTLLTVDEEKKLLRKIDLRLMTLCSVMFLLKNIDADNVSNARIMNKGQPSNIMKELNMTSNEYNLVTTMYYVSKTSTLPLYTLTGHHEDTIYPGRGTVQSPPQTTVTVTMAVEDHGDLG
jgi:hypothetical protein